MAARSRMHEVFVSSVVLAFVDRQMLRRILMIFVATVAQMIIEVGVMWLLFKTNA